MIRFKPWIKNKNPELADEIYNSIEFKFGHNKFSKMINIDNDEYVCYIDTYYFIEPPIKKFTYTAINQQGDAWVGNFKVEYFGNNIS